MFALREILGQSRQYLSDKVFQITHSGEKDHDASFQFVHFKLGTIKSLPSSASRNETETRTFLQMIDVSHKLLYNEAKAEGSFLTLINAAVSHELRNPLNSLIAQVSTMSEFFADVIKIIKQLPDSEFKHKLYLMFNSILTCGKKMASATKFIDFFVHDILDYTLLNQSKTTFMKNITIFNILAAIKEIKQILHDKVLMKEIKVEIKLIGLDDWDSCIVKTD